jgi:hypothetical protein
MSELRYITELTRYREGRDPGSSWKSPGRRLDEPCNDLIRLCDPSDVLNTSLKHIEQFPVVTCDEHSIFL